MACRTIHTLGGIALLIIHGRSNPPWVTAVRFPEDGLFPTSREIRFDCTCPDWTDMCKHVAASLYGAAVRLDEKPELFFVLRGMKVEDFVGTVIEEEAREVRQKSRIKTGRVLSKKDSKRLFGV